MTDIDIVVAGATGRMGRQIIRAASDVDGVHISHAITRKGNELVGEDIGIVAGLKAHGVTISDTIDDSQSCDIVIDFSSPAFTLENIAFCEKSGCGIVIGTTGFSADQRTRIELAGEKIPILLASNTSVGVNVLFDLVQRATSALGSVADIEISETHHRHKVDAPSGTALSLGESVATALGEPLDEIMAKERRGITGERKSGEVGFSVLRGGDVVGEHTVTFFLDGERVELTHRATDRMIFARGAIRAAKWLSSQKSGVYTMRDALGLDA